MPVRSRSRSRSRSRAEPGVGPEPEPEPEPVPGPEPGPNRSPQPRAGAGGGVQHCRSKMDGAPLLGAASPGGSSDEVFLAHRGRRESADDVLHNEMLASYARGWQGQRQRRAASTTCARGRRRRGGEAMYVADYDIVETNLHVISQRSHDSRKHLAARVRVTRWCSRRSLACSPRWSRAALTSMGEAAERPQVRLSWDLIQKGKLHAVADALHHFWVPLLAFVGIDG